MPFRPPSPGGTPGVAVALRGVTRVYRTGRSAVTALRDVSLVFPPGSCTAVMGASGSGKTTLLHCAAGLDRPTSGQVILAGQEPGAAARGAGHPAAAGPGGLRACSGTR